MKEKIRRKMLVFEQMFRKGEMSTAYKIR